MNGSLPTAADRCPRCGRTFTCGAAGPAPCACATVTLSEPLQAQLRQAYKGCLCLDCLRVLSQAEAAHRPHGPMPSADA